MAFLRYVDVVLVVMAAPFVVLMDLPLLGYLAGAVAWTATRIAGAYVESRAKHASDYRKGLAIGMASLIARAWLVALTILVVGVAGEREDGLMAAVLVLAAFTVYFATSLILRPLERSPNR